jgi:hypothetical protein
MAIQLLGLTSPGGQWIWGSNLLRNGILEIQPWPSFVTYLNGVSGNNRIEVAEKPTFRELWPSLVSIRAKNMALRLPTRTLREVPSELAVAIVQLKPTSTEDSRQAIKRAAEGNKAKRLFLNKTFVRNCFL